jgi:hypothetical protein
LNVQIRQHENAKGFCVDGMSEYTANLAKMAGQVARAHSTLLRSHTTAPLSQATGHVGVQM